MDLTEKATARVTLHLETLTYMNDRASLIMLDKQDISIHIHQSLSRHDAHIK